MSHPLRIFLSYGHDANEDLVRRIRDDLSRRGHDVWFDRSEIKSGDDWRRAITDGIVSSHRVLSFLSKYSTRDPGVCLDEIAIAVGVRGGNIQTILAESEAEVRPPASISHIQWLDMHDWQERLASGDSAWEVWYEAKLAEIVRVVESDESRRFAGEIQTLGGHLRPISSDTRIASLLGRNFVGRAWLVDEVERWRAATDDASRVFWITGAPGVGKSAFAAHLAHFSRGMVIAAQFVEWDKPAHRDARRVVRSLAFQLATRLPDYRRFLLTLDDISRLDEKNEAELFDELLARPLGSIIDGGRERHLIVIDALDEANDGERNSLAEMLARDAIRLPEWLGLVVTSRPESAVTTPLQALRPHVLHTTTEANRADIRAYVQQVLEEDLAHRGDAETLVGQLLEKSEGVFLYAERVCADVRNGHLSLDRLDDFPQGLGGAYGHFFARQFPDLRVFRSDVRPALRAILAAMEPLPLAVLQELFGWQDEELHDFTTALGSLFPTYGANDSKVIMPYHKSLHDWLGDELRAGPFFVSARAGHELLGGFCLRQWASGPPVALAEAAYHLGFDPVPDRLYGLLLEPGYYGKRHQRHGAASLLTDLRRALAFRFEGPTTPDLDGCTETVRLVTVIAALLLLGGDLPFSATPLLEYAASGCDPAILTEARTRLAEQILSAEREPRSRPGGRNHYAADTAHFYEEFVEHSLKAEDAALALAPDRLIDCLRTARRFHAIYSCDGDPIGAVNIALQDFSEEFGERQPVLTDFAKRLDAFERRANATGRG